jgi:ATP-binding cassette subfamily C (CFTR/MRP) protein 1
MSMFEFLYIWTLTCMFQSCHMAFWSGIPLLVAFSSFATVAIVSSRPLTSDLIFPAISLFMLLQFPLEMVRYLSKGIVYLFSLHFSQVSLVTSNVIEAVVSIKRLSSFLNSEELQMYRTVVETPMLRLGDEVSVLFLVGSVRATSSYLL